MSHMDGKHRFIFVSVLILTIALLLSGCNLSSAPEEQLELTDVPTNTVLPTRTLTGGTSVATPVTVTALPQIPTLSRPTSVVILPPTAIPIPTSTSRPVSIVILSPVPNSVVAGNVQVLGAASHPQFLQYQLEYGPDPNPGNLWFSASGIVQTPVLNGLLGIWNTLGIQDNVYQLRLRVWLRDGTSLVTVVNNIRVQNQAPTPIPTATTVSRPIAAFTQDRTVGQAPLVVRFFNQSSGNISSYSWNFGDGGTSPQVNPAHTFRNPGIYTVTLTVRGPGGTSNVSRQINVQSPTAPVAGFTQDKTSGPAPLSVQFTDQSSGNITSRNWIFGDGATSAEASPSHTFSAVGTYNVILTVAGPGGSSSVTRQITVENPTIPAPIAALVANPTQGDTPLQVQFDASDSSGQIESYSWDFGDGTTAQGEVVSHTYTTAGQYEARLTVVGPGGQSTATTTIEVIQPPDAPLASFTENQVSGDTPLTVNFDASTSTGPIDTYTWDFGDGTAGTGVQVQHTFADPGTYTVELTVTGPGGSSTAQVQITATEPIQPPDAAFRAEPLNGPAPLPVIFTNQTEGENLSFAWDFGDGTTSAEVSPTHEYPTPGTYTVTLTAQGPGGQDTAQQTITVLSPEQPPVAAFEVTPADGPAPLEVVFTNQTSGDGLTFAWDFGDGATSADRDPVHSYAAQGQYTASLTVTGPGGSDTATRTINVGAPIPAPVASFTADPTSGEAPLTVNFDAQESADITSYAWDFGDGASSIDPNPAHVYASAGNYTVTLTVTGPGGEATAQGNISVSEPVAILPPQADFSANPLTGTAPLNVTFNAVTSENITSYTWDFGDGNTAQGSTVMNTYASAGTFTVTLTVSGPGGQNAAQQPITVDAPAPAAPVAVFSATPLSGTAPLDVSFDAAASTGTIDTYTWDFGDGNTVQGVTASYTYASAGTYTVTLTVAGPGGQNTAQQSITVDAPAPAAPVAVFSAMPLSGTAPLDVSFDAAASTGAIDTYTWDFGDGNTAQGVTASYTYASAGTYTVTLTVAGPGGQNAAQQSITVDAPAPAAPVAVFSATPLSGTAPLAVTFDAAASTGAIDTYTWDFGDGNTAQGVTASYTYANAGTYTVTLTVAGPGGQNAAQQSITVDAPAPAAPVAEITVDATSGTAPLQVYFRATTAENITGYTWDFGDGNTGQGPEWTHTYETPGSYTATLTVTGPGGQDTAQQMITVEAAGPDLNQVPILPDLDAQPLNTALANLYQAGVNRGNRHSVFAVVGGDAALQSGYLDPLADPGLDNTGSGLEDIISWFNTVDVGDGRSSFDRPSAATGAGWRVADLLDPARSNPGICNPGETPLACEMRLLTPGFVIVSVGLNDVGVTDPQAFQASLEQVLTQILNNASIPIVSTLQPSLNRSTDVLAINQAIISAATSVSEATGQPVLVYNLWRSLNSLPNSGLAPDGVSLSVAPEGPGVVRSDIAASYGMNTRNRDTLLLLDGLRSRFFPTATP